jgi:hypothetical protein
VGGLLTRNGPATMLAGIFLLIGVAGIAMGSSRGDTGALLAGIGCAVVGLLFFGPLLIGCLSGVTEAAVLPSGLRITDSSGPREIPWQNATLFRKELFINGFRKSEMRLETSDGRKTTFDIRFANYDQLADLTQELHSRAWLEPKRQELARGTADFGPVALRSDSITLGGENVPWSDLELFTVVQGVLVAKLAGRKKVVEVELPAIPNYAVLFTLLADCGMTPTEPAAFFAKTGI